METPSEKLAAKIMERLVGENLISADKAKVMLPKLAAGKLQQQDWRLPIELAIEKGATK